MKYSGKYLSYGLTLLLVTHKLNRAVGVTSRKPKLLNQMGILSLQKVIKKFQLENMRRPEQC